MEENKRLIVYAIRDIWIYNELGKNCKLASFVSKAYIKKSILEYKEDGTIDKTHFVEFIPTIFAMDRNTEFHTQNGDNEKVEEVFKYYQTCRKYVDNLNKNIILDGYEMPVSLYSERQELFERAVQYGRDLEAEFISAEERNGLVNKKDNDMIE